MNGIGDEGCSKLAEGLAVNSSLKTLVCVHCRQSGGVIVVGAGNANGAPSLQDGVQRHWRCRGGQAGGSAMRELDAAASQVPITHLAGGPRSPQALRTSD